MAEKRLPKSLFVKFEKPENDEGYFVACEEAYGLVDMGDKIKVGRYELVETITAEGIVKLT